MRRVCICENVHFRFLYTTCSKKNDSYCISYNYGNFEAQYSLIITH